MAKTKQPKMAKHDDLVTVGKMAKDAKTNKHIFGVSKLSNGHLKMVGISHDAKIGMVIPRALSEAWATEAKAQKRSKTDLFEDLMLSYLKEHGWEMDG